LELFWDHADQSGQYYVCAIKILLEEPNMLKCSVQGIVYLALSLAIFWISYLCSSHRSVIVTCPAVASSKKGTVRLGGKAKPCSSKKKPIAEKFSWAEESFHSVKGNYALNKVFRSIHHPTSPTKFEIYVTANTSVGSKWNEHSKTMGDDSVKNTCREVVLTRSGSRPNQPNKCIALAFANKKLIGTLHQSHRLGVQGRLSDQYMNDYSRGYTRNEENQLLPPFLKNRQGLVETFKKEMGEPIDSNGHRRTAVVLVANEGVMDLLLNLICSCRQNKIDVSRFMIFVGDPSYIELIHSMGARALYSGKLGSMPERAAGNYLDNTFSKMMWFKMTSVYIAAAAGFHVLFQDVDLVWMHDPTPWLESLPNDVAFMDDGARTPRYTPFFSNSGFYYIKHTTKTQHFLESFMKAAASEIGYTHSHQSVLIRYLFETHKLFGLDVLLLNMEDFPSGIMYHHNKKYMAKIRARTFTPFVFHMCWTANREDKVKFLKELGLWYLNPVNTCNEGRLMRTRAKSVTQGCCLTVDQPFPPREHLTSAVNS
jgi:hypothetical protein